MSDIAIVESGPPEPFVDWRAIWAGAVIAAGISVTLLAFGSAIGLSLVSTAPTWRDSSPWLWMLSGLFLVFVALCGFGFGGYVAGRMRTRARVVAGAEIAFRDRMHGILTWGLAILISSVLALGGAFAAAHSAAPSGGIAGPASSVIGETTIASEIDETLRGNGAMGEADMAYRRGEVARILLKSAGHDGIPSTDRKYLAQIIAARAGISETDGANRATLIIGKAEEDLHRARMAAVMQAFLIAAALMIGAAVAWYSAAQGGLDRERGSIPAFRSRAVRREVAY